MAKTGLSVEDEHAFDRLFLAEQTALKRRDVSPEALIAAETQTSLLESLKEIGRIADPLRLVATERKFLENELARYADSAAAIGSLKEALAGLQTTERLLEKVSDPDVYRAVDEAYSRPKSRIGGLPRDEARQFFSSHAARLVNLDKSRMTPAERALINQRKLNIRTAEKLYEALQRQALGVPAPHKQKGLGLSR